MIDVILVDDHKIVVEGLKSLLVDETEIRVVGEAHNGSELLELLAGKAADVVLMDIDMPVKNGIETTAELSQKFPHVKIIILSIHKSKEYIRQLLKLGASGYILKNCTRNELVTAINKVASGGNGPNLACGKKLGEDCLPLWIVAIN